MIVKQVWTGNAYRNFNYLIACPDTGEALAIDPLDYQKCLSYSKKLGWTIRHVLNTHEHGDHTGGNEAIIAATGSQLFAHAGAVNSIPNVDIGVLAGDVIKVGKTVELECLDTPGHTMSHICLLSHTDTPALFCGDTLFNAGAGNCHNGGHPDELYETFAAQLSKLSDDTLIYPGHEYMLNNLQFTINREPDNDKAKEILVEIKKQDPEDAVVTTLGLEKEINTFFRTHSVSIIDELRKNFPNLPDEPDAKTIFLKLRELRNSW
jgi:hydroxyacylglutathione hydrolase